jgi:hypothetical protein
MKIRISYPQIVIFTKDLELSEEEYEAVKNLSSDERAEFIWSNMREDEQNSCPNGKKGIKNGLHVNYAAIKRLS